MKASIADTNTDIKSDTCESRGWDREDLGKETINNIKFVTIRKNRTQSRIWLDLNVCAWPWKGPHVFIHLFYLFLLCATSSPPFVTSAAPSSVLRWRRLCWIILFKSRCHWQTLLWCFKNKKTITMKPFKKAHSAVSVTGYETAHKV